MTISGNTSASDPRGDLDPVWRAAESRELSTAPKIPLDSCAALGANRLEA
jgi:hypothetical protein